MFERTDDLRICDSRPLIPPAILLEEIPMTEAVSALVSGTRRAIAQSLAGNDPRLVCIVGPCSIHEVGCAAAYAERLAALARRYEDRLIVVMRAYFEKPRTSVGWKGFINDPDLDETYHINKGLRLARRLLVDVNEMGLPTGHEFLDTQIPQHIADVASWVAIGARTTESQVHRELASGLSMPVGFKNTTEGSVQPAIDAVVTARAQHWFPSVTKQAVSAIFQTTGNPDCHVILRGGSKTGPNFDRESVNKVAARLESLGLPPRVMVDCSHGNSRKDHRHQAGVAAAIAEQRGDGHILGVMLESHLVEGRQDHVPGRPLTFGQSITDACIGIEETERILETLARA
ncbi:MAG TPA: 3-deoxy-7-phosphoheptulonate synthase [Fimbriimonadaceae bacterium]|nr:3-deoxy-7-phosphoheptulonate synthase [Fimbriimonadaceae bacterium]HRJ95990.1 3-deoxy-7-phosphoheptulonate synthase [Fimbriimonadaceae bacterium]